VELAEYDPWIPLAAMAVSSLERAGMDNLIAGYGSIGAGGLVAVFIILMLLGKIVPRSTVDDIRSDWGTRVGEKTTEAATWRSAWEKSEASRVEAADQVKELLELGRTMDHFIHSLRENTTQTWADPSGKGPT
jgi:hypothetical protein